MAENLSSIEKAAKILIRLSKEPYEMTALELSEELGINRSTVHRILNILIGEMFVLQNPSSKKYSLGPTTYTIGASYLHNQNNSERIKYILEDLAKETKQSIGYAILVEDRILNMYEIENYQSIKIGYKSGCFYPIHCGAYGKCIMAFYEPEKKLREIVYSADLFPKGPNTITDPEVLLGEYRKIRQQGYAISDEESVKGLIGVGAPVRNSRGKVVASVAVAILKGTITDDKFKEIINKAIASANKISQLLI